MLELQLLSTQVGEILSTAVHNLDYDLLYEARWTNLSVQ